MDNKGTTMYYSTYTLQLGLRISVLRQRLAHLRDFNDDVRLRV